LPLDICWRKIPLKTQLPHSFSILYISSFYVNFVPLAASKDDKDDTPVPKKKDKRQDLANIPLEDPPTTLVQVDVEKGPLDEEEEGRQEERGWEEEGQQEQKEEEEEED